MISKEEQHELCTAPFIRYVIIINLVHFTFSYVL